MNEKKVVTVIVEGPSDENAIGGILKEFFSSEEVQFAVVHGDITSNYSTTKENVVSKVGALIETIKSKYGYNWGDFVKIIHMDEKNNPKYAAIRGTGTSFIGEANGSDKNYSFSIFTEKPNDTMHLFESAIDLLSYATLQKLDGKEWRREHLLSLAGVYQPAKEIEKSKVPAALARALKMHPEVKTIVLHLDNDRIGRLATKAIFTVLPKQYQVKDVPPKQGKDYNDLLCIKLNLAITKREKSTKKSMSGHENMRDRSFLYTLKSKRD